MDSGGFAFGVYRGRGAVEVNFGDILDEWERETAKPYGKKRIKEDTQRATVERDS